MAEGPFPESGSEAARWLLGGVFVFVAGFEGYVMLWDSRYLAGSISIMIAVALTAVLVRWKRIEVWAGEQFREQARQTFTHPAVWIGSILVVLLIIVLSPYLEERRWPYITPTEAPSSQLASPSDAGAGQIAVLRAELDATKRDRDTARQQVASLEANLRTKTGTPSSTPPASASTLGKEDAAAQLEVWHQVLEDHIRFIVGSINEMDLLLTQWQDKVTTNKGEYFANLSQARNRLLAARDRL